MGHQVGKDLYRKLGRKIDGLSTRVPWNQHLYAILKELYSSEEAEVVVRMPYGPATLEEIAKATKMERDRLEKVLASLCDKGLVMDIHMHGAFRYIISPMVIGIFEFTMMRTGEGLDHKKWARLFSDYLGSPNSLFAANAGKEMKVSPLRTLPHAEAIAEDTVEILDYEKATAIVDQAQKCAIGICSCRHEKHHLGEKQCEIPLESCLFFDSAADYLIRHDLARLAPKEEVLEQLAQSRERELVFNADNVQKQISFICQCCGCCCNVLGAINKYGFPHIVVTSNYIAAYNNEDCLECGECAEACPIDAIAAPGGTGSPYDTDDVWSTFPNYEYQIGIDYGLPQSYRPLAGTSMATPHVAGLCALILGMNPNLTPDSVRQILMNTSDDLNPDDGANPGAQVVYDNSGGALVVQFEDYPEYSAGAGDVIDAEIILHPDGSIVLQYREIAAGFDLLSASVGIEDEAGVNGLQVVHNAAYLHDSLAIEFVRPAQWLTLASYGGNLAVGEADTIQLQFGSAELDSGYYKSNIEVHSNDPDPGDNPLVIPAELWVGGGGPTYVCGDADGNELVNISDAIYLIDYIFTGGPAPDPYESGDVNCDAAVNVTDATYIIAYIFGGGPVPCAECP